MNWWQFKKRDADLERELRSDLELEEEEQREGGISEDEARCAALRAFGNPTLIREQTLAVWSWNWFESLALDLRFSLRTLRRTPPALPSSPSWSWRWALAPTSPCSR